MNHSDHGEEHDVTDSTTDDQVESLQSTLAAMRVEADRIASLEASDEQVSAAEQFAEGAGTLDEAIGSAARADDSERA